jgi:hypothetical protein
MILQLSSFLDFRFSVWEFTVAGAKFKAHGISRLAFLLQ